MYRNEKQEELLSYYQIGLDGRNTDDRQDGETTVRSVTKGTANSKSKRDVTQIARLRLVDALKQKDNLNSSRISKFVF